MINDWSAVLIVPMLAYAAFRTWHKKGCFLGVVDAWHAAFEKPSHGKTDVEVWNREGANYLRVAYSDTIFGPLSKIRLLVTIIWLAAAYALLAANYAQLFHGAKQPGVSIPVFFVFFVGLILDLGMIVYLSVQRKRQFGSVWHAECARKYRKQFPPAPTLKKITETFPEGIPCVPWWWMDQSANRLVSGLFRILAGGGVLVLALYGLLITLAGNSGFAIGIGETGNLVFTGVETLLLWPVLIIALTRAAPWNGYGANRVSFALAVLVADLQEAR